MTCKDCIHYERCEAEDACFKDIHFEMLVAPGDEEELCVYFKNKADFVEVVRCNKCKYGETTTLGSVRDESVTMEACYCNYGYGIQSPEWYCPNGEPKNDKE